jgi:hypothetical protein
MPSQNTFDLRLGEDARPLIPLTGLVVLVTAAIGVCAFLILRNESLAAFGALLLVMLCVAVMVRWQRGVYGLLLYLPISGAVTLALLPWDGPAVFNPVVFKDWLFVGPAYLGFAGAIVLRHQKFPRIGRTVASLLCAFFVLVVVEMAHPEVPNALVALIGAKVWLGYLPFIVLGAALATERRQLTLLWRLLAVISLLPCLLGLGEYVASLLFGYERVMTAIYGGNAVVVTQSLTSFLVGGGRILRIPSTFTFETQYFGFALAMLVPAFAVSRADPSVRWRRFGWAMIVVVTLAGLLSGARGAYIFFPLLLILMNGLERGVKGTLQALGWAAAALVAALAISRIAAQALYAHISELFQDYAVNTAYGGLVQSFSSSWRGHGTGTNTGAARYAFSRPELFVGIENFYAKTAYELGALGLLIVVSIFLALIYQGMKALSSLRDPGLRAMAAALTGFLIVVALDSFKGWLVDVDPVNVYFWLFAGVLAGLGGLDSPPPLNDGAYPPITRPDEVSS